MRRKCLAPGELPLLAPSSALIASTGFPLLHPLHLVCAPALWGGRQRIGEGGVRSAERLRLPVRVSMGLLRQGRARGVSVRPLDRPSVRPSACRPSLAQRVVKVVEVGDGDPQTHTHSTFAIVHTQTKWVARGR